MLGYRHAFHAGNHADILKHFVLFHSLRYLTAKPKPLLYLDTHAGAGSYRLNEGFAAQNREWDTGLGRLSFGVPGSKIPEAVSDYLRFTGAYGAEHPGEYAGSPVLAAALLRPQDRLVLTELHPADFEELRAAFAGDGRAQVLKEDGFSAMKAALPPASRRGFVLVDPPYELASEYDRTVEALADALRRFETGTYAVWYPVLDRPEARALPARLLALTDRPRLSAEIRVRPPVPGERGMTGSGVLLVNPPWPLGGILRSALPYLAEVFKQAPGASWSVTAHRTGAGPADV